MTNEQQKNDKWLERILTFFEEKVNSMSKKELRKKFEELEIKMDEDEGLVK